jgi:hypothetical protein
MRWLTIAVAVFALVLVGAGCGGGDDEASGTDTAVITDTTDTDETTDETTTEETTEETDTDVSGDLSGECLEAVQAYSAALAAAGAGGDTDNSLEVFQEFADRAPEEIRDDFQVLAQAYAEYIEVAGDVDLQSGETTSADDLQKLQQAAAAFNDAEVQAANERVTAWADENC